MIKSPSFISRDVQADFKLFFIDKRADIIIGYENAKKTQSLYLFSYESFNILDIFSNFDSNILKRIENYEIIPNFTKFGILDSNGLRQVHHLPISKFLIGYMSKRNTQRNNSKPGDKTNCWCFYLIQTLRKIEDIGEIDHSKQLINFFYIDEDNRINLLYSQIIRHESIIQK